MKLRKGLFRRIYEDILFLERNFPKIFHFDFKPSKSSNLYLYSIQKYEVSTKNVLSMEYEKKCKKGHFSKIDFHAIFVKN